MISKEPGLSSAIGGVPRKAESAFPSLEGHIRLSANARLLRARTRQAVTGVIGYRDPDWLRIDLLSQY
jgi:hypothetical protein